MVTDAYTSPWRLSWKGDHQSVVARMAPANREHWRREGYSTVRSRSLFAATALAMDMKIVYVTYVMEQAHLHGLAGAGMPLSSAGALA
jgi:hypothetical protein